MTSPKLGRTPDAKNKTISEILLHLNDINFDYDNVLKIESEDRTIFKNGYHILKMLYFFDKEYNIKIIHLVK